MKFILITVFALCSVIQLNAQTKPYLAIIKTNSGTVKGIFYKVDSSFILIENREGFTSVNTNDIKSIRIRTAKKNYRLKKVFKYNPYDDSNYERNINGYRVRKWGERDPTLKEQINEHVATGMLNVAANVILFPLHLINPYVAKVRLKTSESRYREFQTLDSYSIYYQENPNLKRELEQLKDIGKKLSLKQ